MNARRAIDHSVSIAAPPEVVWALLSDLTRMGEWSPFCIGANMRGAGPAPEPGTRFTGRNRNGWHRWNTKCTVLASDPGREIAWAVAFMGFSVAFWRYRLEPAADGTTLVTESWRDLRTFPLFHFKPSVRLVTGARDVYATTDAGIQATLAQLKSAAESLAAPRSATP